MTEKQEQLKNKTESDNKQNKRKYQINKKLNKSNSTKYAEISRRAQQL